MGPADMRAITADLEALRLDAQGQPWDGWEAHVIAITASVMERLSTWDMHARAIQAGVTQPTDPNEVEEVLAEIQVLVDLWVEAGFPSPAAAARRS